MEAKLIIDLRKTDLPAKTLVYIYVVGLVSGSNDTFYYLDKNFNPKIMAISDNTQAAQTFPGMKQLSTEAQKTIAPSYPLPWADWSIPVKVKKSLELNLGAINTTNIPTLGTGASAFSGRIYISVGVPRLPFTVQTNGYTEPVFDGTLGKLGSPGWLTQYDWIEFSYDSSGKFNGNTTQVNQFGLPLTLTGKPVSGETHRQGIFNTDRNTILSNIAAANTPSLGGAKAMIPVPAGCAAAYPTGTNYLRAISPITEIGNSSSSPLDTYFDANIKTAYEAWHSTPLVTHDPSSGAYTGVVFPVPAVTLLGQQNPVTQPTPANYPTGSLVFYEGNYPTLVDLVTVLQSSNPPAPAFFLIGSTQNTISSNDIWQCVNSLASGSAAQKNVGKMIAAAFNRGVMVAPDGTVSTYLNDGTCATLASTFYPTSGTFNAWAKAFQGYNRNGLAYGFPYDDVCDQNPSIALVASSIRIVLRKFGIPTPFIRWTRDDKWLYGADVSAQWASKKKREMVLTVSFGPEAKADSTTITKEIDLSVVRPGPESVTIQQGSVLLNLNFTWQNPAKGQKNPKINFNGNIVESGVANVAVDSCLCVTVDPAS